MLSGDTYPSGEDGLHALTCLVATHESHRLGGRAIKLTDPALPRSQYFHWA